MRRHEASSLIDKVFGSPCGCAAHRIRHHQTSEDSVHWKIAVTTDEAKWPVASVSTLLLWYWSFRELSHSSQHDLVSFFFFCSFDLFNVHSSNMEYGIQKEKHKKKMWQIFNQFNHVDTSNDTDNYFLNIKFIYLFRFRDWAFIGCRAHITSSGRARKSDTNESR